jgi:RHS repeat-associated protein
MTRRFTLADTTQPDWALVAAAPDPDTAAEALLSAEGFRGAATHDALGRPDRVDLPDGSVLTPTYDEGNRIAALDVLLPRAAAATRFLVGQSHDPAGRPTQRRLGNGVTCDYSYDPESRRLSRLRSGIPGSAALMDLAVTYDPVGNVTGTADAAQQTRFFANAVVTPARTFTYDALYQLVAATGRELAALQQSDEADVAVQPLPHVNDTMAVRRYTEQYTYDDLGNLTVLRHLVGGAGWTRRYRYAYEDDAGDRTNRLRRTSAPGDPDGMFSAAYAYDPLGNMTAMPHLAALDWGLLGQLAHVDLGSGGDAFYFYGAAAGRLRKVVQRQGGLRVETLYLGDVEVVRETLNGVLRRERWTLHVSDDVSRIAQVDRVTVDTARPLPPTAVRYVHADQLGSAVLETNEVGDPIAYEEYLPFGTTAYRSSAAGQDVSLRRYRYLDRERDDETALYHLGARYYAPWLGRWTSPDPAGFGDGPNLYRYCRNNPVSLADRSGLEGEQETYGLPKGTDTPAKVEAYLRSRGFDFTGPVTETSPGVWDVGNWLQVPGQGAGEGGSGGKDPAGGTPTQGADAGTPGGSGGSTGPPPGPAAKTLGEGGQGDAGTPSSGEGPGTLGSSLSQTPAGAERFIWQYDFPGTGLPGTQRGRILEWLYGVRPWRSNTKGIDHITDDNRIQQIKSTESFDNAGKIARSATRDAADYITANPTTTVGSRPQAVVITPTDTPAAATTEIATALNPGRGRKIPLNAVPPEHVRGLPGTVGRIGAGLAVIGTALSAWALVNDYQAGDVPMGVGDALGTVGGGLEVYALGSAALGGSATVLGVSAMSAGLVLGGAGIAVASGVSAYRAYQRGDTAGVVVGAVGVAAGLAIMAGVIFGAPVLLVAGLIAAVGVGLYHLGSWLGSTFGWW